METENQYFEEDGVQAAYCECTLVLCGRDGNYPLHYRYCYNSSGQVSYRSCDCY